jgi:hypothetical protein
MEMTRQNLRCLNDPGSRTIDQVGVNDSHCLFPNRPHLFPPRQATKDFLIFRDATI